MFQYLFSLKKHFPNNIFWFLTYLIKNLIIRLCRLIGIQGFLANYIFGLKVLIDTTNDAGFYFRVFPGHDFYYKKLISDTLKSDSVFFDVGSNAGFFSLIAATKTHHVHSFEPNIDIYRYGLINYTLNNQEIHTNNCCVGAKNGTVTFYENEYNTGLSSIYRNNAGISKEINKDIVSLDHYVETHSIESIDFMKIDVEGAEGDVLHGSQKLLEKSRIGAILWETNNQSQEITSLLDLLQGYGFEHFAIDEFTGKIRSWKKSDNDCLSILSSKLHVYGLK